MIATYTGKLIDPFNVQPYDIDIKDIAHGLSLLCRYAGQCKMFYSVAEHCILMAEAEWLPGTSRAKLLHDAAEAYINDLLRAVKKYLPEYKAIENRFMQEIACHFAIPIDEFIAVKEADSIMLASEAKQMMPNEVFNEFNIAPVDSKIVFKYFNPEFAEWKFLKLAEKLL